MSCRTPDRGATALHASLLPAAVINCCRSLNKLGGHAYVVGGAVRDLALEIAPKDFDVEVYGLPEERLIRGLNSIGRTELVGKQFGVIKFRMDGIEIDVALPRTEHKTERGHRGFAVTPDPGLAPEIATLRRDFTINAMMFDPQNNRLLDFHHGLEHLRDGILKHVSPAFSEDPLRVLRGMQFAARFKLAIAPETARLCRQLLQEADSLPASRIWIEWQKWSHAEHPSYGLRVLQESGWIDLYPELSALNRCPQDPRWHPEGDVWLHTLQSVDQAALLASRHAWSREQRELLLFATLCHDLGKPECTRTDAKGVIRSPGHSSRGRELSRTFLTKIAAPGRVVQLVLPLVQEHMTHMHGAPTPRAVRNLAHRLAPATIEMWEALVEADASGRSPAPPCRPAKAWLEQAEILKNHRGKPAPILTGEAVMAAGVAAGPAVGELLAAAYQAQLDGEFEDVAAAQQWLSERLSS